MEPNLRQPRRFRLRLSTLLVVIAFLALLSGAILQSVLLERERRRSAVMADRLAAETARAGEALEELANAEAFRAQLAKPGSKADSGPEKPDSARKK